MNNYTQKVDKVGIDEVFPYPIKLEYDDEHIYLTPLWIPESFKEQYELGPEKYWLCIEISTLRSGLRVNKQIKLPKKKFYIPGNSYNKEGGREGIGYNPNRRENYAINNFQIGQTYTFQYPPIPNENVRTKKENDEYLPAYYFIRGTYREGTHIDWISRLKKSTKESYSNIIKINY